ncbi:MAG: hypothetical protein Q7J30_02085 [Candidatus Azambacteria bacterium]|nr:hypothetical protein [Candidatus Azambacteria bacterium]
MKYLKFSPIILALAFLLYYYFGIYQPGQLTNMEQKQWETKTDEQPPVSLKITPIEFGKDAKIWKFAVVFDTHSGSLDEDPIKTTLLLNDKGNIYQPIAWEGSGPGGHHREGVLVFNAINPVPAYVELKIKDVGGIAERIFRWNLE